MDLETQVKEALAKVRPSLQNDGGDIDFVKIDGKKVYVKLRGACAGCSMAEMTLKGGVERMLQVTVDPEIVVENIPFDVGDEQF